MGCRVRISQFPGSLRLFKMYSGLRQQILTFPATFGRFPAMVGLRSLPAEFWPENGRKSKFFNDFLCVGKFRVEAFQRTSNQLHISFCGDSKAFYVLQPKISKFGVRTPVPKYTKMGPFLYRMSESLECKLEELCS